jgi:hypothetical protein
MSRPAPLSTCLKPTVYNTADFTQVLDGRWPKQWSLRTLWTSVVLAKAMKLGVLRHTEGPLDPWAANS